MIDGKAVIPTREQARWMLERLTLIREFEERLKWLVENGVPVGAVHLYIGQEAVAVGTCAALRGDDWIASTHRGHGHCIAKGVEVRAMMAELYGKATGTNRGKGGSMHVTDITKGVLGVNPIVGAGAAHAIGAGLSAKVRKTDQVCAAFFGEGAAGIGTLHEAMNMAAIWKLGSSSSARTTDTPRQRLVGYALAILNIADRAASYNMPAKSWTVRTSAVYDAVQRAVARARSAPARKLDRVQDLSLLRHHQGDDPSSLPHQGRGAGRSRGRLRAALPVNTSRRTRSRGPKSKTSTPASRRCWTMRWSSRRESGAGSQRA
jgi:pyruvate dehydrogenase E1 component alpha subunit